VGGHGARHNAYVGTLGLRGERRRRATLSRPTPRRPTPIITTALAFIRRYSGQKIVTSRIASRYVVLVGWLLPPVL
jgi:hypothetical protein